LHVSHGLELLASPVHAATGWSDDECRCAGARAEILLMRPLLQFLADGWMEVTRYYGQMTEDRVAALWHGSC
jgi:hypothetical protein